MPREAALLSFAGNVARAETGRLQLLAGLRLLGHRASFLTGDDGAGAGGAG